MLGVLKGEPVPIEVPPVGVVNHDTVSPALGVALMLTMPGPHLSPSMNVGSIGSALTA
jgi:hypothetical protein